MSLSDPRGRTERTDHSDALGGDLLVGAEAIARELNWRTLDGRWNRRRVYHLAEQGILPIHRVRGLGLCARRSALRTFFENLDQRFLDDVQRSSEQI